MIGVDTYHPVGGSATWDNIKIPVPNCVVDILGRDIRAMDLIDNVEVEGEVADLKVLGNLLWGLINFQKINPGSKGKCDDLQILGKSIPFIRMVD